MLETDKAVPAGNAAVSYNVMTDHSSILGEKVIQRGVIYLRSEATDKQSDFSVSLILPLKAGDRGLLSP